MNITRDDIKIDETKPYTLYLENGNSIIGGIVGSFKEDLIAVDLMWIEESYRRQGFGKKLLHKLDAYARGKNCKIIQLATFDFQAKVFYEKHGYECIGTIAKLYKDIDLHYIRKVL